MTTKAKLRVNLGHRLDALSIALKNLETDSTTGNSARQLISAIRASSDLRHMKRIADAALDAEKATHEDFADRLRNLINVIRDEMTSQKPDALLILLVTTDAQLSSTLQTGLDNRGYKLVVVRSSHEAQSVLDAHPVAYLIVDVVISDRDGRDLVTSIRSKPVTASLPVIIVAPPIGNQGRDQILVHEEDGYFSKPIDLNQLIDHLDFHLKRSQEQGRESRRDLLTGHLNRAAFHEAYYHLLPHVGSADPLAFAILGINDYDALARQVSPVERDSMIRHIGAMISSSFRSTDVVCRWGASEFAILLPGEDHYGATRALEKVLAVLNRQKIATPSGKSLPLTMCAGLTILGDSASLEETASTAERFLYTAYHMTTRSPDASRIASDANPTLRRNEQIALCLADPNTARTLKQLLENDTFQVTVFSQPDDLISAFDEQRFHLLIVDDELPNKDGFRILEQLQRHPRHGRLRVVMIVGKESSIPRAIELGASDYALKPISVNSFLTRVRRALWHGERLHRQSSITIMIVDHELAQLLVAGPAIHQEGGYCVLLARGANDALQRLEECKPNYLILDMHMPDMPGTEFLKRIPQQGLLKDMVIIPAGLPTSAPLLSSDVFDVRRSITRPFKPATFVQEVRAIIPPPPNEPDSGLEPPDLSLLESEVQRILSLRA